MNIFSKLTDWFYDKTSIYSQIKEDREKRRIFLRTIREETADMNSKFTKLLNFKLGDDNESLVCIVNIPDNFQNSGNEYMIYDKLNELTNFHTNFLREEVGFGQFVALPEFYHVEDPTVETVSMTYLAVWRFSPYVNDDKRNKALGILYGIPMAAVVIGTICGFLFL